MNHNRIVINAYVTPNIAMLITKASEHFGLSKDRVVTKLIELGIEALGEDFERTTTSPHKPAKGVSQIMRKQL